LTPSFFLLHGSFALRPRTQQVDYHRHCIFRDRKVQPVIDGCPVFLLLDQSGFFENIEMAGEGRFCQTEMIGDLAGAHRSVAQQTKYLASIRIRKRLEYTRAHPATFISIYIEIKVAQAMLLVNKTRTGLFCKNGMDA